MIAVIFPTCQAPPTLGAVHEDLNDHGLAIKEGYPIVQVTVYDAIDGINKAVELSKTGDLRVR